MTKIIIDGDETVEVDNLKEIKVVTSRGSRVIECIGEAVIKVNFVQRDIRNAPLDLIKAPTITAPAAPVEEVEEKDEITEENENFGSFDLTPNTEKANE